MATHLAGKLYAGPSGLKLVFWYSAGPGDNDLVRVSATRPPIEYAGPEQQQAQWLLVLDQLACMNVQVRSS